MTEKGNSLHSPKPYTGTLTDDTCMVRVIPSGSLLIVATVRRVTNLRVLHQETDQRLLQVSVCCWISHIFTLTPAKTGNGWDRHGNLWPPLPTSTTTTTPTSTIIFFSTGVFWAPGGQAVNFSESFSPTAHTHRQFKASPLLVLTTPCKFLKSFSSSLHTNEGKIMSLMRLLVDFNCNWAKWLNLSKSKE